MKDYSCILEEYSIEEDLHIQIPYIVSKITNFVSSVDIDSAKGQKLKLKSRLSFLEFIITRMLVVNIDVCEEILKGYNFDIRRMVAFNTSLMEIYNTYLKYNFSENDKIYIKSFIISKLEYLSNKLDEIDNMYNDASNKYSLLHINRLLIILDKHAKR